MAKPHPFLISLVFGVLLFSCAHRPVIESMTPPKDAELTDSGIEIEYRLGHTTRRFVANAKELEVTGSNTVDHQVLKEGKIDSIRYKNFLAKTLELIKNTERTPAAVLETCRSPFKVSVRIGAQTQDLQACRTNEESRYGRLVKDGEFLLYR